MSLTRERLFDIQNEQVEEWIRERLSDKGVGEDSEEWQDLLNQYSDYQEHLQDEFEWKAEVKWLKENDLSYHHEKFFTELDALKNMAESNLENPNKAFMLHSNIVVKMSYAYAVTLLETFLGDTFKALIIKRENFLENAIKNVKEIKNEKYSIFELSKTDLNICSLALSHTTGIHFHNISKVQEIYSQVLGIKLQLDISKVCKITSLRHDIVHRNGYTTDGKLIELDAQDFFQTIEDIKKFSSSLQEQINEILAE